MKAKDTVMSDGEILKLYKETTNRDNFYCRGTRMQLGYDRVIAQAQAEISFKAGIKEVVEWINANTYWREDAPYKSALDLADWKPQLKEWGITK